MLSFLKNLWDGLDAEKRKNEVFEKFEEETRYFEVEIGKEEVKETIEPESRMRDYMQPVAKNVDDLETSGCYQRSGIITSLKSNHGTIDNSIFFDITAAQGLSSELRVGNRIEYLAYQKPHSDHIKVVKIKQITDQAWDQELPTEKKIEQEIAELKNEKPTFFNTHQRNILGLVIERKPDSILIDTDYKTMDVNLDTVEIDFVPIKGDRVFVCCNVQSDENFVDKQGEILQEVSVHPARLLKQEKCSVLRVNADWGVLVNSSDDECYFTFDVVPIASKLTVDTVVCADLIECARGQYVWRCIKLSIIEQSLMASPPAAVAKANGSNNGEARNRAVEVSSDVTCIFTATFQRQEVELTVTNNLDRPIQARSIDMIGRRRDSQVRMLEPVDGGAFELPGKAKQIIRFLVESKFYGESREAFVIKFDTFLVKRSIKVIVCEDEASAALARANARDNTNKEVQPRGRNTAVRSRQYAQKVWSNKSEVIPGVGLATKRRFIAYRIGFYEVPERLRSAYLNSVNKQEMLDNIEAMFPTLTQELTYKNYASRFQTLIYLEEIEYFVNFRTYDRERAHFKREAEFLSLAIENLAERRPSLVIGDTVRAINPWGDKDSDNRSYDGVIHKVLYDRVLLKFNSGFQNKYNGEDYRLEFYFSRFAFRKQHFAVNRIVKHLGEQFLFPSKVHLRENLQLNADLDKEGNLLLDEKPSEWYNPTLNPVQKRAIRNILRGEAERMPYIIFGPPGTGKTMTLIETILQLVKNLPSSRLLVGTPSNSSADLITTRLIESKVLQPGDFVRLVSQNQIEKDLIPDHLKPYCATVDIAADGTCDDSMIVTESGLKLRCQMKYLGRHRVTISTCTTLGNFIQMDFPPGHFTHVLIDESGQCTEAEVMIPITQVSQTRGQVVLAGDPHQLQSIVINKYAADRGFSQSYLERITTRMPYVKDVLRFPETSGFDPRLVTKLLHNYRALPSILNVYNELFYDSELIPKIDENHSREATLLRALDEILPPSEVRPKTHGVFFYGSRSENKQERDSPSWYNPLEARNVFLMTIKLYRQNVQPENIGIITPYMKQVKHLRSMFMEADIAMPKIGSVEEFQGQERDIILISTVRSTTKQINKDLRYSLGFVQSAKRMNVAISRARYLMLVFGNPHLLSLDHCWHTYIKYCVDNEAYLGCDLPENFDTLADGMPFDEVEAVEKEKV